jgi:hypothetical protein
MALHATACPAHWSCSFPLLMQVSVVGVLLSKNITEVTLDFSLYDGTGTIKVKQWIEDGDTVWPRPICACLHTMSRHLAQHVCTSEYSHGKVARDPQHRGRSPRLQTLAVSLAEGRYVRVYGSWKGAAMDTPAGRLGPISAFAIRPIDDHNEARPPRKPMRNVHCRADGCTEVAMSRFECRLAVECTNMRQSQPEVSARASR